MPNIDIPWHQPISVKLQNGNERKFHGAYDALDFLENEWPVRKGQHYDNALRQCRAALMRVVAGDVAREAFVAACVEASLRCRVELRRIPRPQMAASRLAIA